MVHKTKILRGCMAFLEDVERKSEGNNKVIVRGVIGIVEVAPDYIWDKIKSTDIISIAVSGDEMDVDMVVRVLLKALANDTLTPSFKLPLLGVFKMPITANDINELKGYIERA
jgi:hypothetical protein